MPGLAAFTDSIYVFHLGISIFLCPGFISLLWTGPEGEGSFQLPVMDGGCFSHQQQVKKQINAFGFFKSMGALGHFVLHFQSLLPQVSSPALQVAPSVFSCLSAARGSSGTVAVPGPELWIPSPFHLLTCGTLGFSSHPKTSQDEEIQADFLSPLFAPGGQSQQWGTHTPANPPKPGRNGNFLKIHEKTRNTKPN